MLLLTDLHWDNPKCRLDLLKQDLEIAKANDYPVMVGGDFFCGMQGKYDPRSDKSSLRPEHQRMDYLDALVETAAEWFDPYKEQLTVLSLGNHETAIMKRHETCLIERLVERLRAAGSQCQKGGYDGWLQLRICTTTTGGAVAGL